MAEKSEKVTDKQVYLNRRLFMQAAVLAGTATASTLLYRRLNPPPAERVEGDKLGDGRQSTKGRGAQGRICRRRHVDAIGSDHQLQQLL